MIALDASVLVAYFATVDPHQDAAVTLLRRADHGSLLAHPMTLAEVLVGGVRAGRHDRLLVALDELGVQEVRRPEGEPLRLARLRVETGRKLPDCCVLDTAITNVASLATFDNALASAARQLGVEVQP